ncbi:MAG: hypothetical protein WBG49_13560 [Thermoanaerobaculia bacterium]
MDKQTQVDHGDEDRQCGTDDDGQPLTSEEADDLRQTDLLAGGGFGRGSRLFHCGHQ